MAAATDTEELLEPDLAFHRHIAEATNNDLMAYIGNMLSLALRESILLSSQLPNTHELSLPRLRRVGALEYRSEGARPYVEQLRRSPSVQALLRGSRGLRWTPDAHVVSDPPQKAEGAPRRGDWLIDAITPAFVDTRREMFISSPYFVPGEDGVASLLRMRDRGVRIGILTNSLAANDVVITTALVPGQKAPVLVTEEQVKSMRPGSVIVDLAAEQGGNVVGSEAGKDVVKHGVTIIGGLSVPSNVAFHASQAFSRNIEKLLLHITADGNWKIDLNEEITKGCVITKEGEIVQPKVRDARTLDRSGESPAHGVRRVGLPSGRQEDEGPRGVARLRATPFPFQGLEQRV